MSGRLHTAVGGGLPIPPHSRTTVCSGRTEIFRGGSTRNWGAERGKFFTDSSIFTGMFRSMAAIAFVARQEYCPESDGDTDLRIRAPDGSCGTVSDTGMLFLRRKAVAIRTGNIHFQDFYQVQIKQVIHRCYLLIKRPTWWRNRCNISAFN